VKIAGAAYLIYLGVKMFVQAPTGHQEAGHQEPGWTSWQTYRQGVATNLLNPKVALFFLAFLPQFVSADCNNRVVPFLLLGSIFLFTGTLWCLITAIISASITSGLRSSPRAARLMNRLCGGVLVGLGVKLAFARSR
jgi:threonine/homoserine/homoserine lactone efflux protein